VSVDVRPRPILAIELSQRSGGVAVIDPLGLVHEMPVAGGRRDSDELGPAIAKVLDAADVSVDELAMVVVDEGPGGFTGLRVSIAMGQAIAEAVGARAVSVPGALVAAASTPELAPMIGRVLVLSAAKAGTAWGTLLERSAVGEPWLIVGRPGVISSPPPEPLMAVLADEHLDPTFRARIPGLVPVIAPRFEAAALARLGKANDPGCRGHDDPACLQPCYPREPEAVRLWRERSADNAPSNSAARPS
jgi:tRNA threonylcarbamoyl adenosine modification protein YeaZ